tara:strand:- start:1186 stop:1410 length:225 start_codon:yes stop_codon:yes gene_type:complete
MVFYFASKAIAVAAHITLEEVGADCETQELKLAAGDQRGEAYLGINSKGRVPAPLTDVERLNETPTFLLYLAQL